MISAMVLAAYFIWLIWMNAVIRHEQFSGEILDKYKVEVEND